MGGLGNRELRVDCVGRLTPAAYGSLSLAFSDVTATAEPRIAHQNSHQNSRQLPRTPDRTPDRHLSLARWEAWGIASCEWIALGDSRRPLMAACHLPFQL